MGSTATNRNTSPSPKRCVDCGTAIAPQSERCRPCYLKHRKGPAHPAWVGTHVSKNTGRVRAIRAYPIAGQRCADCEGEAKVRHHADNNTSNNDADNIVFLCYRCHTQRHIADRRAVAERRRAQLREALSASAEDASLVDQLRRLHAITYEELAQGMAPPRSIGWVRDRLVGKSPLGPAAADAMFTAIHAIVELAQ